MLQGKYFEIPRGPVDVERIWERSQPLTTARLPSWLTPATMAGYRYVGSASCAALGPEARAGYFAELSELEAAWLITDRDPVDPDMHHVYVSTSADLERWSVAIFEGPSLLELAPSPQCAQPVLTRASVTDVPAAFVADPFMVCERGTWYLFCEVMNWRANKGEIGLATSHDGWTWSYQQIVLAEVFHLSYPYVFKWRNDFYMVPETHQAGAVRLYRAARFPTEWVLEGVLLEGEYLVDASVFRLDGRWWLLVDTSCERAHDTLRLYHADELMGPWVEHGASPIVERNAEAARPAGRVLVTDSTAVRFAQGCLPSYGTDVRAFEITLLTASQYAERPLSDRPILAAGSAPWNRRGMHHIDAHPLENGQWIACVDGRAE